MPSQDVVLGLYYVTRDKSNGKGEGMAFADIQGKCKALLDAAQVELHTKILP